MFASVMGECEIVTPQARRRYLELYVSRRNVGVRGVLPHLNVLLSPHRISQHFQRVKKKKIKKVKGERKK
jgi:hypothetical protein